jgi:NAD(P)-dependent dehydrogenase (short-subunit alcohol dehydrogenase family)
MAFARQGAKVALSDANAEGGEKTANMIKEAGGDSVFIYGDVSKAADGGYTTQ